MLVMFMISNGAAPAIQTPSAAANHALVVHVHVHADADADADVIV
jgi:hypothetical protein